ncbi:MAG: hypothetical protein AB7P76_11550 [Candidatus Melainabacteria bacterium]
MQLPGVINRFSNHPSAAVLFAPGDAASRRLGRYKKAIQPVPPTEREILDRARTLKPAEYKTRASELYPAELERAQETLKIRPRLKKILIDQRAEKYIVKDLINADERKYPRAEWPNVIEQNIPEFAIDLKHNDLVTARIYAHGKSKNRAKREIAEAQLKAEKALQAHQATEYAMPAVGLGVNLGVWLTAAEVARRVITGIGRRTDLIRMNPFELILQIHSLQTRQQGEGLSRRETKELARLKNYASENGIPFEPTETLPLPGQTATAENQA